MLKAFLEASGSGGATKTYVDDVFSAYTYTGTGSSQSINNGIDLAGKGGLVWVKSRSQGSTNYSGNNFLIDTVRGPTKWLSTNGTAAESTSAILLGGFNSNGFTSGTASGVAFNGDKFASWTFRKAPKFFDVVTYTGEGTAGRQISHSLGVTPGMVIIKQTDVAGNHWYTYHRSLGGTQYLRLSTLDPAIIATTAWNDTNPTASVFTVGTSGGVNVSGSTYVAYLFAHDPSADGLIQCGSYTANNTTSLDVEIGFEPQFLLVKNISSSTDGDPNWVIMDTSRGLNNSSTSTVLRANTTGAEVSNIYAAIRTTGITVYDNLNRNFDNYIYMAIRRPNKPPTTGTQVYNAIARNGTATAVSVTGVGFAPDLVISDGRFSGYTTAAWQDKLRGANKYLLSTLINFEHTTSTQTVNSFDANGITLGTDDQGYYNQSGAQYIEWFFKRAPGFMDIVCYTGTGVAHTEAHGLGVVPELIITKGRSVATTWVTYASPLGNSAAVLLNATDVPITGVTYWNSVNPTSTAFSVGSVGPNNSGATFVAYLFASKAGISKVGSYTGNGTSQVINCGFSNGARFVMIKRTDSTGDWYVWDTVRGIVAANDPHLSLNTTAAEVTTDDSIDPDSSGYAINQNAATNINVNGASYIYLAIA